MRFKDHAKLIDKCNVLIRIKGTEEISLMKDVVCEGCLNELIESAAKKLVDAKLDGNYMVSFDLMVHAMEMSE